MTTRKSAVAIGFILGLLTPAVAAVPVDVSAPKKASVGQTVTVCVKTDPDAKCKIEAQDVGLTQSLKLFEKNADFRGNASWTFDIPKNYRANELPVTVTVQKNGEEDKAVHAIMIKK